MKRFLLSVAIAAIIAPNALGQAAERPYLNISPCTKYDPENKARNERILISGEDEVCITPYIETDSADVIALGQIIGSGHVDELTSASSVITETEIAARGQQYISDLLRSLPGIAVNTSGPGGGLTQIRVRGSEANHVLVLIDGVEVANPSSGEFDFSGLRAEDVVRVETLRGEQSALYGSDAIGGVINIITSAGSTREGWRTSVEAGGRETLEGQVSAVISLGDAALSLNGNAFTTEGYDISGLDGEKDGSKSRNLNIGLNNVTLGELTLSGKFGSSRLDTQFDEDSNFNGRLNDTNSETTVRTETARIDARFGLVGFSNLITAQMVDTDTDTRAGFSDSTRQGVELEARWDLSERLSARGAATFLDSEQNDVEEIRRPDFIASASVTYSPADTLSFTATVDHNGSQLDTDFGTFQNVTLDAFTLLGLNAAYNVSDTVSLTLRGDNLLDEDYQEVFGYASPGRTLYGGVKASF